MHVNFPLPGVENTHLQYAHTVSNGVLVPINIRLNKLTPSNKIRNKTVYEWADNLITSVKHILSSRCDSCPSSLLTLHNHQTILPMIHVVEAQYIYYGYIEWKMIYTHVNRVCCFI